jgi:hypothetical protein
MNFIEALIAFTPVDDVAISLGMAAAIRRVRPGGPPFGYVASDRRRPRHRYGAAIHPACREVEGLRVPDDVRSGFDGVPASILVISVNDK